MASTQDMTAPGPGSWDLEAVHFPRRATRFLAECFPPPFERGFAEGTRRYGVLIDRLAFAYVDGWTYQRRVPVAQAEVPRRIARAKPLWEGQEWKEDLRHFRDEVKPVSIKTHLALQEIEPTELDDDSLSRHFVACLSQYDWAVYQHHRFNMTTHVLVGDFLRQAQEWTSLPQAQILRAIPGADLDRKELTALRGALREDATACRILASSAAAHDIVHELSTRSGPVGAALTTYLALAANRSMGHDVDELTAREMPDVIVTRMRRIALEDGGVAHAPHADVALAATVRDAVPASHRNAFDTLLADVAAPYALRDERGVFFDLWTIGLVRRAMLAAGARLNERGKLRAHGDALEASPSEIRALLAGSGPSADELAARAEYRVMPPTGPLPMRLGDPPPPPPPIEKLPPDAQRTMRALLTTLPAIFKDVDGRSDRVTGIAGSAGVYVGPVCSVRGPEDFHRLRKGDVLVAATTNAAFDVILPMVGAVVTAHGGALSHAAIVAREFGVPAVVGCGDATARLSDGARVRVDGTAGTVDEL